MYKASETLVLSASEVLTSRTLIRCTQPALAKILREERNELLVQLRRCLEMLKFSILNRTRFGITRFLANGSGS